MTLSRRHFLTSVIAAVTPRRSRPVAFTNEITGGQGALVRPAIKSPNYVPGVSGWTIKRDGSAEFNNLTVRGTFNGTDFIINASGLFLYSGAPAAGNLTGSIAPVAGTDAFGNPYPAGFMTQDDAILGAGFTNINGSFILLGQDLAGGAEDNPHAAQIANPGAGTGRLNLVSGSSTANPNKLNLELFPGTATPGSGPVLAVLDSSGTTNVQAQLTGDLAVTPKETGRVPLSVGAPAGQTAHLLDLSVNSVAKLSADASGNIVTVGTITPLVTVQASSTASATYTSTSYGAASTPLSATAVLPASGKALVRFGVRGMSSVSGDNVLSDVLVSGSTSGTLHAATDATAIQWAQTFSAGPFVTEYLITGVAGETLTATAQHRVNIAGSTGTALDRYITISTLPA